MARQTKELKTYIKRFTTLFAMLGLLVMSKLLSPLALTTTVHAQQRSPDHQRYCLSVENELAKTYQRDQGADISRAKLKNNIRTVERTYHRLNYEADRRNCYSQFLFSKQLRKTPRCIRIHKKIMSAKRQLQSLNNKLENLIHRGSNKQARRDDLISALARNKCGRQYEREHRKRNSFSNWFDDGFFGGTSREQDYDPQDRFRFATHRTLCVRLCDGYYFPMSFATTTNRFSTDEEVCQSKCAAPAQLFTYPNPGGNPQQMFSINGMPYGDLKNAWRFKKEFVKGCSCKAAEYNPLLMEENEKAAKQAEQNKKEDPPSQENTPKKEEADNQALKEETKAELKETAKAQTAEKK